MSRRMGQPPPCRACPSPRACFHARRQLRPGFRAGTRRPCWCSRAARRLTTTWVRTVPSAVPVSVPCADVAVPFGGGVSFVCRLPPATAVALLLCAWGAGMQVHALLGSCGTSGCRGAVPRAGQHGAGGTVLPRRPQRATQLPAGAPRLPPAAPAAAQRPGQRKQKRPAGSEAVSPSLRFPPSRQLTSPPPSHGLNLCRASTTWLSSTRSKAGHRWGGARPFFPSRAMPCPPSLCARDGALLARHLVLCLLHCCCLALRRGLLTAACLLPRLAAAAVCRRRCSCCRRR